MVSGKAKTNFDGRKVQKAAKAGNIQSLGHAAAAVRLTARRSIKKGKRSSAPGTPPHTQTKRLPAAIKYAVDNRRGSALIGPDAAVVGDSGKAHEFGGLFRGEQYPRRPFMGPALEKIRPRLSDFWAGSVKGA